MCPSSSLTLRSIIRFVSPSVAPTGTVDQKPTLTYVSLRPDRVQRPAVVVAQSQRAQPDRLDRHVREEPVEELGAPLDRHLDVLDHAFARRAAVQLLEAIADVEPPFEPHELPVRAAAQVAAAARSAG